MPILLVYYRQQRERERKREQPREQSQAPGAAHLREVVDVVPHCKLGVDDGGPLAVEE